ncbi:MiaB/RimO family radical SAM methylthiotransferase [candidate division WOR-3 bacterium]|nr:MiaB/RimO family radical SAM methylthiotransferase [candidate division WOR-3 bacterium]
MHRLINLGCKLNQYEGYCLLEAFRDLDDLVIVNTCCVTNEADLNSRKKFRQALRQFPDATVIATGCACRLDPEPYAAARYVIDNVDRNTMIKDVMPRPDRARYFLKIQDGCDQKCTYCIVAKVRTRVESRTIEEITREMEWAAALGHREIVLVGANIGLYGRDTGTTLKTLLAALGNIRGRPRIRLSSIEPPFITPQLVKVMKEIKACRHFHIPIQSGDNTVLTRMNRAYGREHLENIIGLINGNFEEVAIGADLIVGFPAEGEEEFLNTYNFINEQPFTHLHVFPYSPRPGTGAYDLGDPVPKAEKKNRLWVLKNLIKEKNHDFRRRMLGKNFQVVIEHKDGTCLGLTDNYIKTDLDGPCAANSLIEITVDRVTQEMTHATPCVEE